MRLRNRLVMLPVTTGYTEPDESIGDRFIDFFAARAKGGAGLIIVPFAPAPGGSSLEPGLFEDRFLPGARRLTQVIHSHAGRTSAQLIVSYHLVFGRGLPEVVGPSPVMNQMMRVVPRVLTIGEIQDLIESYGQAAQRAREAGFDGVEILVGGGYLLNRFLSPISNHREDEYGGTLENRMRILLETVQRVKERAGRDFPVGVRLNTDEQMTGGHTIRESKIVARALEAAGVDLINVYTGWHESPVPTVAPSLPPGAFAHLAEGIKGSVRIPVITANRINSPETAERLLSGGKADLIGMARALIADPELPNKAREGRVDEIIPCIACSNCLSEIVATYKFWGKRAATFCTVNPGTGREGESVPRPEKRKKVVVIGGGPAGMEAAITAATRGHEVTLYEKGERTGGWLLVGCLPPHKSEIKALSDSLDARTAKAGVRLLLRTEATPERVETEKPDVLILALGARPLIPDIPGATGSSVVAAEDILAGQKEVSGSVIIIGGGLVGCETAEFLAGRKGITRVTVVEMLERMAGSISPTYRPFFLARLKTSGIQMRTGTIVEKISATGVKVRHEGSPDFIAGDAVVLAVGLKAENVLLDRFRGKAPEVYLIGDCVKPRTIKEAIEEGFRIGTNL
jgi:2,4-dienoyl-CoA reductase-like NADH-dependent reductase (Old Yellow Enzyme family)/thioredoxin reductase